MNKKTKAAAAKALGRAIQEAGVRAKRRSASAAMATVLKVTRQAVEKWDICPPLQVLPIERATGVSRHDLRPDLYPRE